MHSVSSIGAATVVDQTGQVQPDKYQSYMRSLMRTTAESRGRRTDIAEAMVDPDIFVWGGSVSLNNPQFIDLVYEKSKRYVLNSDKLRFALAECGADAGLIGAALLVE